MGATRRNILTILGLSAVGSPALASDDLVKPPWRGQSDGPRLQKYDPERMAKALELLAAEIRIGARGFYRYGEGVEITQFNIASDAVGDGWLQQTLTLSLMIGQKSNQQPSTEV